MLGQAAFDANFPHGLAEYLDVDLPEFAGLKSNLVGIAAAGAQQEGLSIADSYAWAGEVIQGKLGVVVINQMLAAANQRLISADGLERGLFYALIGKQSFFTQYGSRYIVVKSIYDLYTGLRHISTDVPEDGDPFDALVRWYFNRNVNAPDATRVQNDADWDKFLLDRLRTSGAAGVIVLMAKFCEPHMYFYPEIKEAFDREGIPNLLIETEHEEMPLEALKTRVETFMEITKRKAAA